MTKKHWSDRVINEERSRETEVGAPAIIITRRHYSIEMVRVYEVLENGAAKGQIKSTIDPTTGRIYTDDTGHPLIHPVPQCLMDEFVDKPYRRGVMLTDAIIEFLCRRLIAGGEPAFDNASPFPPIEEECDD